jgi:predicted nucleotidyltransferase
MREFWKSWKRKTKREEAGIKTLKKGLKLLRKNIPKKEIISIYVKGSFVRREMNKRSDVDTFTVLKSSKGLNKLRQLEKKYRDAFKPQIQFSGYSMWEIKNNKRVASGKKARASPSRAIEHLEHYKLVYGKPLKKEELTSSTDKERLKGMVGAFNRIFIPGYNEGKIGFAEIIKQVFWITENEQKVIGKNPPHSFKKLSRSIKDKNHIIHDALKYRKKKTKDKRKRAAFIKKLKKYLEKVEKLVK